MLSAIKLFGQNFPGVILHFFLICFLCGKKLSNFTIVTARMVHISEKSERN